MADTTVVAVDTVVDTVGAVDTTVAVEVLLLSNFRLTQTKKISRLLLNGFFLCFYFRKLLLKKYLID
jgi:hypothetical protein